MCRISGFWHDTRAAEGQLRELLSTMQKAQQQGGPDGHGQSLLSSTKGQIALGHNRLAIIDLSDAGKQPMHSPCKRYSLLFNGEIYNYRELRKELQKQGCEFCSQSDTELLLQAYMHWGEQALQRFRGMWAFVLWDAEKEELTLCRDRLGVKPLYYMQDQAGLAFSSELKGLEPIIQDRSIDKDALAVYLKRGFIPAPQSIYKKVRKLEPGCLLRFSSPQNTGELSRYYDIEKIYAQSPRKTGSIEALAEEAEEILTESFALRLVADVPVGCFLSGGIDSSIVLALLAKKGGCDLRSFTIGFEDPQYNEAEQAKAIAQHLGSQHQEYICSQSDFETMLPLLPELIDEPMGDSSIIPTALVAKLTAQELKVSLSADGGDELFGGYSKYELASQWYPRIAHIPKFLRTALSASLGILSPEKLESLSLPILRNYKQLGNKIPKLQEALQAQDLDDFFDKASAYISDAELGKLLPSAPSPLPLLGKAKAKEGQLISYLGVKDIQNYLQGDILHKVDRATMFYGLEGREPFLDPKIISFALSLGDEAKIQGKQTKYLLRHILRKQLPSELIDKPKQGFSIPIEPWLRSLLSSELNALCHDAQFLHTMGLEASAIQELVEERFLASKGKRVHPQFIWFLYLLYVWYKKRFLG